MASNTPLTAIPTISELYRKGELAQAPSDSTLYRPSSTLNAKISLIRADITKLATTCIVNAANTSLLGGGGVDGAIHAAAGPSLYDECLPLNGCPTGSAKITSAHDLPSTHIIHAVGPIYAKAKREGGETRPAELLEGCYRTSLDLAAETEVGKAEKTDGRNAEGASIAFSCLSTGVYGYPSNEAAGVASRCVRDWLEEQEQGVGSHQGRVSRVVFCCFLEKDVKAYEAWLPRVFPPAESGYLPQSQAEERAEAEDLNDSTGATQTLASTTLSPTTAPERATKKQKTASASSQTLPTNEDDKDWEAVEKPQPSLASSTIESASEAGTQAHSDVGAASEGSRLEESAVDIDAAAAKEEMERKEPGTPGEMPEGVLGEEGVEVEKPRGLEEDEGVKVEKPIVAQGNGEGTYGKGENMLGKDW